MAEAIKKSKRCPLADRIVAVTRMCDQAAGLAEALREMGAEVVIAPTIQLVAVGDYGSVDEALQNIDRYDWLVLTSINGVNAMFGRLARLGIGPQRLAGSKIAAVGPATAAKLAEQGLKTDLLPDEAVGEALAKAIIAQKIQGKRVLLLRADIAGNTLPDKLTEAGARIDDLAIYRTVPATSLPAVFLEAMEAGRIDWITLTSPSTLMNLLKLLGPHRTEQLRGVKLASIGPVTTKAIQNAGLVSNAEADPHDVSGLVAAIIAAERAKT